MLKLEQSANPNTPSSNYTYTAPKTDDGNTNDGDALYAAYRGNIGGLYGQLQSIERTYSRNGRKTYDNTVNMQKDQANAISAFASSTGLPYETVVDMLERYESEN